jgi:peptide/nickel transport system substrate-binding protein
MTSHATGRIARLILLVLAAGGLSLNASAQTLRIGLSSDVTSIDPHWSNSGPNVALALHIFEPLTFTDRNGRLAPGLATSWKTVDATTWEIKLREGVKFQDGTPLTADDVVFSLDRPNQLSGSPAPFTQFVKAIIGKQIVNPTTLRLKTATPYVLLPYDLNSIMIVEKRVAEHASNADFDSGTAAIGTGPFKLVSFKRGDRIELARNDGYWGSKPVWQHVTMRMLSNDAARLAALYANDVDAIENVPTADIKRVGGDSRFKINQQISWRTIFFHMEQQKDSHPDVTDAQGHALTRNPFKDLRVRQAMSLAINRDAIVSRVMEDLAIPASNLVSPGIFGYNQAIPVDRYDLAEAKKLLADAGYPAGFQLVLHAPNNRYVNDARVAEAVAGLLSRAGITTKVVTEPWTTYLPKARNGDFAFAMVGWGSSLADNTIKAHLATPDAKKGYGNWNFGHYSNPKLDAMLDHDFTEFNDQAREADARDMMAFAMADHPVIPLYHMRASWATRHGISYPGRVDEFTLAAQFTQD